jgi:hypothetical protein
MWYTIFKILSIVLAGIIAIFGDFFEYRKEGKLTRNGKIALALFLTSLAFTIFLALQRIERIVETIWWKKLALKAI